MSIAKKHAYRFKFLKSEDWKTVRIAALARDKGRCVLCRFRDLSNDEHHVWYQPNVWDTEPEDLVTLCRPCHDFVHAALPKPSSFPDRIGALTAFNLFRKALRDWLDQMRRAAYARAISEEEQSRTPGKPYCRACGLGVDIPGRNILVHFELRRMIRICDACWPQVEPRLPTPIKGPYDDNTVVNFIHILAAIRRDKRKARIKNY